MIWQEHVYLMIDHTLVASSNGTSMVREEAWKHDGNPIITERNHDLFAGEAGYRIWISCLTRDGGIYRMWYTFRAASESSLRAKNHPPRLGYAESDDGLHFEPKWQGDTLPVLAGRPDLRLGYISHDPVDPESPYKALILRRGEVEAISPALRAKYPGNQVFGDHGSNGWFVWGFARSRDGMDWQLPDHDANLVDAIIEGPSMHRALDGGLVIANQPVTRVSDVGYRKVKGWVTYDGRTGHRLPDYLYAVPDVYAMVSPIVPFTPNWHGTPWVQSHVRLVTARKGPTMLALHGNLYGATGCETYAQVADIGLAISDTGYWFQQVWPFQPIVRRGERGTWDYGLVVQQALVDDGDQSRIYYQASAVGNADGCPYRLGFAYFDRDRFGYRVLAVGRDYGTAKDRRGSVTLKPLDMPAAPAVTLNVDGVNADRVVRIGIRDDAGRPIPGYTLDDCLPIRTAGIRVPVRWSAADARALAGRRVVVEIELHSSDCRFGDQHSPRVYALYTADPGPND